ncbi:uncharacterized protein N7515_002169 [Penicillium bovifimosum]|uniref:Uncharacterized protein n=1 Tax=Penicillium bovifimosum TaxID=126998 RepID=A0A9W9HB21_9EURO|nr:uncharacterized protein N7515_002169 [Penicillium bovifimosum]KAJ5143382.1 hypothetical protein N7515_002169 [Penicillium bovifimosum]
MTPLAVPKTIVRIKGDFEVCFEDTVASTNRTDGLLLTRANTTPIPTRRSNGRHLNSNGSPGGSGFPRRDSLIAADHAEPTQPANIQDLLEYRLNVASQSKGTSSGAESSSPDESHLTAKEIKAMLSGAPHFLLEKGKYGRYYPQVIFPWDEQNPVIQHMWDRKPLPHASFTLSTLHAHLPLPEDWAVKGGVPMQTLDWRRCSAAAINRATFDIGVFEVPNMLSNNGKEPGTIGFRNFLELPVADAVKYTGPEKPRNAPYIQQISTMGASGAFDLMEGYSKPYSQCQSGAVYDRHRLICEGPEAWKRIGVRDVSLQSLVERLEHLRKYRHEMLTESSGKTLLDLESPRKLYDDLYTKFLYPRPPSSDSEGHPEGVKAQIKTLALVLATPGAWINFSLPEWRLRAGQVLWEASLHGDGDCMDPGPGNEKVPEDILTKSGMERKWLLIQLLLSAELLLRLDAFVRVDMLHKPHGGHITIQEIRKFDKMREGKLNWDLIVVRRFLNSLTITCAPPQPAPSPNGSRSRASSSKSPEKPHRFGLLDSITRRHTAPVANSHSAWDCQLSSSHVRLQLEGLYVFAENVGWPRLAALKATLEHKLGEPNNPLLPDLVVDDKWGQEKITKEILLAKDDMYTRNPCRRRVKLWGSVDPRSKYLGWISRSWLSGFVIPGEAISHLLMATILENDADALNQLGSIANLYGGFVYCGRSWWSKACVVGRVLSSSTGAKTCMGWISSNVMPRDAITGEKVERGWLELPVEEVPRVSSRPRIRQGAKLAYESTPLGVGKITAESFTLPMDDPEPDAKPGVTIEELTLTADDNGRPEGRGITSAQASISFLIDDAGNGAGSATVRFPLKYNVRFVSAHECCPPLGVASRKGSTRENDESQQPKRPLNKYKRLPGHPLHTSYRYKYVPLSALPTTAAPQAKSQDPEASQSPEIIVVDARGSRERETFVRAWCAAVGCHAIISRSGGTRVSCCIACSIRQARAISAMVVIRVGD